jgi:hypothetical protein
MQMKDLSKVKTLNRKALAHKAMKNVSVILIAFVLFGFTLSSCSSCNRNKDKDEAKPKSASLAALQDKVDAACKEANPILSALDKAIKCFCLPDMHEAGVESWFYKIFGMYEARKNWVEGLEKAIRELSVCAWGIDNMEKADSFKNSAEAETLHHDATAWVERIKAGESLRRKHYETDEALSARRLEFLKAWNALHDDNNKLMREADEAWDDLKAALIAYIKTSS